MQFKSSPRKFNFVIYFFSSQTILLLKLWQIVIHIVPPFHYENTYPNIDKFKSITILKILTQSARLLPYDYVNQKHKHCYSENLWQNKRLAWKVIPLYSVSQLGLNTCAYSPHTHQVIHWQTISITTIFNLNLKRT